MTIETLSDKTPRELETLLTDALYDQIGASNANDRRRDRIIWDKIYAIREELVQRFAEAHGWKHTERWFSDRVLAERKVHSGARTDPYKSLNGRQGSQYIDHAYFFRDQRKRTAGLVVHLYNVPSDIEAEAAEAGLRVSYPDFPSWWRPGGTTLVLYTSLMEARP